MLLNMSNDTDRQERLCYSLKILPSAKWSKMFKPVCSRDPEFAFPLKMFALKWNGAWPYDRDPYKRWQLMPNLYLLWSWLVIANIAFNVYAQAVYLFHNIGDVVKSTENVCTTVMGALSLVRLIHLRFRQRELRVLLRKFVAEIWIPKNSYAHIERGCVERMSPFDKMAVLVMCTLSMYCIFPIGYMLSSGMTLDSPDKPFPYKMLHPFEVQRGWHYIATYLLAMLSGLGVVTQWFGQDTTFGLFVSYACGQFDILQLHIARLIPECHEQCVKKWGDAGAVPQRRIQRQYVKRLNELYQRHNKLIEFCALLEKFNGFPLLVNFVFSTFLICAVGFQFLSGNISFFGDYVKFLAFFMAVVGQLYVICANGDALIQHSTATAWHLYACNWEGGLLVERLSLLPNIVKLVSTQMPPQPWKYIDYCPTNRSFRMKMKFMIMRSQRPVQLTAMKYSVLSLQTFTKLMSTSMSYFTMLRQLLDK